MPEKVAVYWRDIPAQVIVRAGRRTAKRPLPERFEQAIQAVAGRTPALVGVSRLAGPATRDRRVMPESIRNPSFS